MLCIGKPLYNHFNTSKLEQNGRNFTDAIRKCIRLNDCGCIFIKITWKREPIIPNWLG